MEKTNCTVYRNEQVIFESDGSWLHPLFELESYLTEHDTEREYLSLEDKIIGRGAAVLIAHLGIPRCHGRLVSSRALPVFEVCGIEISWDKLVERIDCRTEDLITDEMSIEDAYALLAERAGVK